MLTHFTKLRHFYTMLPKQVARFSMNTPNEWQQSQAVKRPARTPLEVEALYISKFGMSKQSMINFWLDLKTDKLMEECRKYGLPVADRGIQNIQVLLSFINGYADSYNDLLTTQVPVAQEQDKLPSMSEESESDKEEFEKILKAIDQPKRATPPLATPVRAAPSKPQVIQNFEKTTLPDTPEETPQLIEESLPVEIKKTRQRRTKKAVADTVAPLEVPAEGDRVLWATIKPLIDHYSAALSLSESNIQAETLKMFTQVAQRTHKDCEVSLVPRAKCAQLIDSEMQSLSSHALATLEAQTHKIRLAISEIQKDNATISKMMQNVSARTALHLQETVEA